ncbi:MAG: dephospho-CoA kinase [Moraxellaceae bacterium]|nr:dephospho-CoA kinase [Moraxellaceae bacterium]MDZ4386786.1 dephospho-CoA kinase [Moraxellaceae bacterium]
MANWILGLTGGIGSGKTAATDYFQTLGIVVVDADVVAREVVAPGQPALADIAQRFGHDVIAQDGTLNRPKLREIVFADASQRQALEAITHPAIHAELIRQLQVASSAYAILATPLLWETGQAKLVDHNLVIDVPEALQLQRASQRDGNTEAQIKAIMAAQLSRDQRLAKADDVITNTGSLPDLYAAIDRLHPVYLQRANA